MNPAWIALRRAMSLFTTTGRIALSGQMQQMTSTGKGFGVSCVVDIRESSYTHIPPNCPIGLFVGR